MRTDWRKKVEPTPTSASLADQPMSPHDEIAVRAYELYLEHGGDDGHDLDDWLQAERELIEQDATMTT